MAWYNNGGNDSDAVLSSRVRFARNVKGYPFPPLVGESGASEIIVKVKEALPELTMEDMRSKSETERRSYVEKHLISPEFAAQKLPSALFLSDDGVDAVMVCEEDHIRIQAIYPGLALHEAFTEACRIDDRIDDEVEYAYDEKLGYLTHCPTNLGTGMRASVMMFLPALTISKRLIFYTSQLEKLGLTMRGMFGEGSTAEAYLYQLSNSVTMGITEDETIAKLENVVKQIIAGERQMREQLLTANHDLLSDRVMRALGLMKFSYRMSSEEFLKLFAELKFGADIGIIKNLKDSTLCELLIGAMPATLMLDSGADLSDTDEAIQERMRSEYLKRKLSGEKL